MAGLKQLYYSIQMYYLSIEFAITMAFEYFDDVRVEVERATVVIVRKNQWVTTLETSV